MTAPLPPAPTPPPEPPAPPAARRRWLGSLALLGTVVGSGGVLAAWKNAAADEAAAGAALPEPVESVAAAVAAPREHRGSTSAIGTVLATRSVSLRNELPGTVRAVALQPGRIVEPGTVLVALDVRVERAELEAQRAQAALARTLLERTERMAGQRAASATELDQARAEYQVALAQIERTQALIERKTIRAPFRARVGMADVHVGQFLDAGTPLTTLQGIDEAVHVDFSVSQGVAESLRPGQAVRVVAAPGAVPLVARVVAVDARVDRETRTATVRARVADGDRAPAPGASVRVEVPVGEARQAVAVPASAVRKGPAGEHVFVLAPDRAGRTRAHLRTVRTGPLVGDEVIVIEGLAPGERVAAAGSFKLHDAAAVSVAVARPDTARVSTR